MTKILNDARPYPLAVFAPSYGVTSETFIRRHMEEISPGGTVAVAYNDYSQAITNWSSKTPKLLLDKIKTCQLERGLWDRFASRVGIKSQSAVQLAALRKFLSQNHCKVFMGEYLDRSLPFIHVVKDMGLRFFVHAHGYDLSQKFRDPFYHSEYVKYKDADGVITVNQIQKTRLVEVGIAPENVHVIPCGVDIPDCSSEREPGETVRCLAVGRMVGKKSPLTLLEAFWRAMNEMPSLHLDYVGDGPLWSAAERYVKERQMQNFVTLHGAQSMATVHSLMRASEIFIQHSVTDETGDEEGLPVAILEAMAHAMPIVATRHAGIPEAVIEEKTGLLVDEGDSAAMAEAVVTLAQSKAQRVTMGAAGQRRAASLFSSQGEILSLRQLLFD